MTPHIEWCSADEIESSVRKLLRPAGTALDIGCGLRPQNLVLPEFLICVEPHPEYASILAANLADANAIVVSSDALSALRSLPTRSVDTALLIDVIEHMTKDEGKKVIAECQRVSRRQIVIFTPLGFMPQEVHGDEPDGWNLHGAAWQQHKSGWYPEDFPDWRIVACRDFHRVDHRGKPLDAPYGTFYAVKDLPSVLNCFNTQRAEETLKSATTALGELDTVLSKHLDGLVMREALTSELKCAVESSRQGVVNFIQSGHTVPLEHILHEIASKRDELSAGEAQVFEGRINSLAAALRSPNGREESLLKRTGALAATAAALEIARQEVETEGQRVAALSASLESAKAAFDHRRELETKSLQDRLNDIEARRKQLENAERSLRGEQESFHGMVQQFRSSRLVRLWLNIRRPKENGL